MLDLIKPWLAIPLIFLALVVTCLIESPPGDRSLGAVAAAEKRSTHAAKREPIETQPKFATAGVCARCHVVSVLEWSVSGHPQAETTCQKCHGASLGHVANERNEVKPDRLPRGEAIAGQLCMTCHETGCPDTKQVQSCQKCHHVHALIHPTESGGAKDKKLEKLLAQWKRHEKQMDRGQEHVERQEWELARTAFRTALQMIPGDAKARQRLAMCGRRLQPPLPGFEMVGKEYDTATGLPREVIVSSIPIPMRLVPPGDFDMGSDTLVAAQPLHSVRMEAFFLGQNEITQTEWTAVMGTNPAAHQGEDFPDATQRPVERVSWDDCQMFIEKLNSRVSGGGFRLPTEAEWEYACRAGGDTSPASDVISEYAWCRENSLLQNDVETVFLLIKAYAPRPVRTLRPNSWGFYDMQGNVTEWCSSLWRPYIYDRIDGRESPTEPGLRVLRGGSYSDAAAALDPARRHAARPHRRLRFYGLRLARSVPDSNVPDGEDNGP